MVNRRNLLQRGAALGSAAIAGAGVLDMSRERPSRTPAEPEVPKSYVLLLVDRSGSMNIVREATRTSLNEYLDDRAKEDVFVSLLQFDGESGDIDITETFDFMHASVAPRLLEGDYVPRGSTPLYAAFVEGVKRIEKILRPIDRVLMVLQTDGGNTLNSEITVDIVKSLIEAKKAEGNWTFVFMGADIDAWGAGASVGVSAGSTMGYTNNNSGTAGAYAATSSGTASWAASGIRSTEQFYVTDPSKPDPNNGVPVNAWSTVIAVDQNTQAPNFGTNIDIKP